MTRKNLARLAAAATLAVAFSPVTLAGQIFGWELNLSSLGGPDQTGINNLSFNGESYITNTPIVVPSDMQCRKPSPALGGAITAFASQVEPRYKRQHL